MIPLLPPLVEFMDPASLCHYSGTSKMLRKEVRDTKAWALLARAQLPRIKRDVASEALSHVKSHVRRRLLADALSQDTPPPVAFRPNRLEDFTFFVRFEEDGRMIWEGDLKSKPISHFVWFDLGPVWDAIRRARSWVRMEQLLTVSASFVDFGSYLNGRVKITIVAIRDEDDAMVSLGQFIFNNGPRDYSEEATEVLCGFESRTALFSNARFNLRLRATLVMEHDAEGHGSVNALELKLYHHFEFAVRSRETYGYVYVCSKSQLEYLLSYLAGTHHLARASALATIDNWHDVVVFNLREASDDETVDVSAQEDDADDAARLAANEASITPPPPPTTPPPKVGCAPGCFGRSS